MNRRELFRKLGGVAVAAAAAPFVVVARETRFIEPEPTVHHTHLSNVTVHGPLTVTAHGFEMRDSTILCESGTAVRIHPAGEGA